MNYSYIDDDILDLFNKIVCFLLLLLLLLFSLIYLELSIFRLGFFLENSHISFVFCSIFKYKLAHTHAYVHRVEMQINKDIVCKNAALHFLSMRSQLIILFDVRFLSFLFKKKTY